MLAEWIPDLWVSDECQEHDDCYATCGAPRFACDIQFLANGGPPLYFAAIRAFGGLPYKTAQKDCKSYDCKKE
jgi:hypothetical protein